MNVLSIFHHRLQCLFTKHYGMNYSFVGHKVPFLGTNPGGGGGGGRKYFLTMTELN